MCMTAVTAAWVSFGFSGFEIISTTLGRTPVTATASSTSSLSSARMVTASSAIAVRGSSGGRPINRIMAGTPPDSMKAILLGTFSSQRWFTVSAACFRNSPPPGLSNIALSASNPPMHLSRNMSLISGSTETRESTCTALCAVGWSGPSLIISTSFCTPSLSSTMSCTGPVYWMGPVQQLMRSMTARSWISRRSVRSRSVHAGATHPASAISFLFFFDLDRLMRHWRVLITTCSSSCIRASEDIIDSAPSERTSSSLLPSSSMASSDDCLSSEERFGLPGASSPNRSSMNVARMRPSHGQASSLATARRVSSSSLSPVITVSSSVASIHTVGV